MSHGNTEDTDYQLNYPILLNHEPLLLFIILLHKAFYAQEGRVLDQCLMSLQERKKSINGIVKACETMGDRLLGRQTALNLVQDIP